MNPLTLALPFLLGLAADGEPRAPRVVVVQIVGELDEGHMALVKRAAAKVRAEKPDLVLVELDTPGGEIGLTTRLGEALMGLAPVPTAAFVRPVADSGYTGGAWSAGAYLAFSCKRIYMYPGTVMGAAAPIMVTPGGVEAAGEKFVSGFREKFRARAEQNGYPPGLAVAMVDKDLEIFEVVVDGKKQYLTSGEIEKLKNEGKRFDVPSVPFDSKDKLLTLTARQVEEIGMGKIAESRSAIYAQYGLSSPAEETFQFTWSESLARFITSPAVAFVLLVVGILGIWIEFKTPGFGAPGVVGILALGLYFFGHHLSGLAEVPDILLVVLGAVLILVELLFFPGVAVFAITGSLCVLAGLILSMQSFTLPSPSTEPWQMDAFMSSIGRVLSSFVGATVGVLLVLRFLPRVPVVGRVVLQTAIDGVAPAPAQGEEIVGRQGHAVTPLHPGGKVEIDGQVHDVVAEGEFIAAGEPVAVLRVEGARVVVGKLKR